MYQLSELRTELGYLKKDLSDVDNDVFISWCRNIQRYIYRRLVNTDPSYYAKEQTYTVFNGTQALPSDFGTIRSMDTGFFLVDTATNQPTTKRLLPTNFGSYQPGFNLKGSSEVTFFSIPRPTQYVLRYCPKTVGVQNISDYFTLDGTNTTVEIVPDDFLEFIIKALDVFYCQWDEEVSAEGFADARFIRVMDDLFGEIQRTPEVYDMNPFNQIV
jgi:hypothetical protein